MNNTNKKTILVIEDDRTLNKALLQTLSKQNFSIVSAFDGKEGLEMALEYKPDLILLDLLMPVMDGYEFMRQLREDQWGSTAQVVILTNFSMSEQQVAELVLEKKPLSFFVKSSLRLKKLAEYVDEIFSHE